MCTTKLIHGEQPKQITHVLVIMPIIPALNDFNLKLQNNCLQASDRFYWLILCFCKSFTQKSQTFFGDEYKALFKKLYVREEHARTSGKSII